jgi:hypothetical protein
LRESATGKRKQRAQEAEDEDASPHRNARYLQTSILRGNAQAV